MVNTITVTGAFALTLSVASQAFHVDFALHEDQVALSHPEIETSEALMSADSSGPVFPFADLATTNDCCCGDDKDKKPDPAKSQCPALTNQTKIYDGWPTTFYCTGHIAGSLIKTDSQPTLEACAANCGPTSGCFSIDYDKNLKKCWYYKEGKAPKSLNTQYDSAVMEPKANADCNALDGTTRKVEGRSATFYCSKVIDGNWSSMTKEASLLACSIKCAQTDGCRYGDYDSASKACKLITDGGTIPGKANSQGIHSFVLSNTKCETLY